MANKITASITFYFKGETFIPSLKLDLDDLMQRHHAIPPLHNTLANAHKIDSYSYQYEMMLGEDIHFSHAEGDAAQFLNEGKFDQLAFEQFWQQQNILNNLQPLIKQALDIDDIEQHPNLKQVLVAAYQHGKNSNKVNN